MSDLLAPDSKSSHRFRVITSRPTRKTRALPTRLQIAILLRKSVYYFVGCEQRTTLMLDYQSRGHFLS